MANYESKAIVKSITATSRASVKIGDSFYTIEYQEERVLPEGLVDEEVAIERKILWDVVNGECDGQIEDIYKMVKSQEQAIKTKYR